MEIGLYDVDSHNFPNLCLMKLSAYYKANGHNVYTSKIFGSEYSQIDDTVILAGEEIRGGTGFCITIEDGLEVYHKELDTVLPDEIEHFCPDYTLYPEYKNAIGFLTRGCPNNCPFCIVSKKEGRTSHKVADLNEWYRGQKQIDLMDANILSCKDHLELLQQLKETEAKINFFQGLDARFITKDNVQMLSEMKVEHYHFAFDLMKNKDKIVKGLETFRAEISDQAECYVLTNFNTDIHEDLERVRILQDLNILPYITIYRKATAPKILKDLQRWCNNRWIYGTTQDFLQYVPRGETRPIKELYDL